MIINKKKGIFVSFLKYLLISQSKPKNRKYIFSSLDLVFQKKLQILLHPPPSFYSQSLIFKFRLIESHGQNSF